MSKSLKKEGRIFARGWALVDNAGCVETVERTRQITRDVKGVLESSMGEKYKIVRVKVVSDD